MLTLGEGMQAKLANLATFSSLGKLLILPVALPVTARTKLLALLVVRLTIFGCIPF